MGKNRDVQIEVARGTAMNAGMSLAGKSQLLSGADSRRNANADLMDFLILLKSKFLLCAGYQYFYGVLPAIWRLVEDH